LYTAGVVGRAERPPTHLAPDELTQGDVHRGHPKPRPESRPDLIVYLDSGHAVALACGLLGCCLGSQSPLLAHVYKHTMHHRMQLCDAGRSVSGAERQGCLFGVAVMAGRSGMRVGDGERRGVLGSGSSVVGSSGSEGLPSKGVSTRCESGEGQRPRRLAYQPVLPHPIAEQAPCAKPMLLVPERARPPLGADLANGRESGGLRHAEC